MEDRSFSVLDFFNDNTLSLFSVLDGHGGEKVVDYCKHYLPILFK